MLNVEPPVTQNIFAGVDQLCVSVN